MSDWPGQEVAPQPAPAGPLPASPSGPLLRPVLSVPQDANQVQQQQASIAASRASTIEAQQRIAEHNAQFNPDGTPKDVVGIPPDLMHLTGNEFLSKLPASDQAQVKALAEGRMAFPAGKAAASPYWQQRLAQVSQYDPDFDAINYNARAATRRDFTSGTSAKNVKALNTAIGHVAQLATQIDGTASHGGFPGATTLNSAENALYRSAGSSGITNFSQTAGAVAGELTQVFRGSGGAEADIKRYLDELDPNASAEQKKAAVANILTLLKSRLDALNDQYTKGMGTTAGGLNVLDPHAVQALTKYLPGFDPTQYGGSPPNGGSGGGKGPGTGPGGAFTAADSAKFWGGPVFDQAGNPLGPNGGEGFDAHGNSLGYYGGASDVPADPKVVAEARKLDANLGQEGAGDLAQHGFTLGLSDEAAGVGNAIGGALTGDFHIGDNYRLGRDTEEYRLNEARHRLGWGGTAAELVGGFALPMGAAGDVATAGQAARDAAVVSGVGGFGYGRGAEDSAEGAAIGTVTGAGLGFGAHRLADRLAARAAARAAQPAAPGAAQNYAAGQRFGMDLSAGDAGGMSPKIVERMLDVQPGSGTVMNNSRRQLGDQMVSASGNVADTFGAPTSFRGIGETAQQGIKNWKGRFDVTAGRAYDAIPIKPDTSAVLGNTVSALESLTSKITSNPKLAGMLTDKRLVGYLDALRGQVHQVDTGVVDAAGNRITRDVTEGGQLSWNDLKQVRSRIGEEIGEQRFGEGTLKSDLRHLYGALSEDMQATAQAQGPAALRAFQRANNLYRDGQDRLDRVWGSILGPDGSKAPEAAAAVVQRIAREGKSSGDLGKLVELRKTLKPDEWGQVGNGVIRLLGQPANSEGRQFAADTFVRNYADMAPEAKNLLFGGEHKELRQNLDEFARVVGLVGASGGTRNTSNTAMGLAGLTGYSLGGVPGALGQALMSYGAAKLWTNPKFVRWATGYSKMIAGAARNGGAVNPGAFQSQVKALGRMAANDNAIAADALGLQQHLVSAFQQGSQNAAARPDDAQRRNQSADSTGTRRGSQ